MSSSEIHDEAPNYRYTVVLKILIFATITVEGLFYYVPGPTLLDLIERVFEPVENVTLIYCARAVGRIIGILMGSLIFQWLLQSRNRFLLLFFAIVVMSVTYIFLAITVAFDAMSILFGLSGLGMGILDTGINAICLHSMIHTSTFFCILSCFYGFGAFMSPVLARSFLRESVNISSDKLDVHLINYTEMHKNEGIGYWTPLSNIYVITAALLFLVALLWFAYYAFAIMRYSTITEPVWIENEYTYGRNKFQGLASSIKLWFLNQQAGMRFDTFDHVSTKMPTLTAFLFPYSVLSQTNVVLWNFTILNASLMTFVSEAIAFGYTQMLPSYITINYRENQLDNLDPVMMFLGFFVIGRIATIFLSTDYFSRTPPKIMLAVSIILIFGGVIVLYLDHQDNHKLFLAAQAVLGLGVGPIFINTYLWLCCKVYVTHQSTNAIFIMHSVSELIIPWLMGKYIWLNPGNIKHFMAIAACLITLLYLIQYCLVVRASKEACPDCEQEAAARMLQLPILQRMGATAQSSQLSKARNRWNRWSFSKTEARGVTSFTFIKTDYVLQNISELEKRVQRGNAIAKSAFKSLEYTVKR